MALTTVTLHGEILELDGLTPAVGTVTFKTLVELNDVVDNITYPPATFVETLDLNGEFTIVLPATDNPDITPLNWVYQAYISTATWRETIYFQLPFAPGVTEFADLTRLDYDPCAGVVEGVPVPPEDAALFVLKAGDTMTGNLTINANLQVNGAAGVQYTSTNLDIGQLLVMGLSTSVISGGELTPNVDPTKVDISAMTGYIVDYNSSAPLSGTNPTITFVSTPAQVGVTPAFPITWFAVDSAGTYTQLAVVPTPTQRRTHIQVGFVTVTGGVIVADQTVPVIPSQLGNQFVDLMNELGAFGSLGNQISANGVNLTFNKATGDIFARGFSQVPTYRDPHNSTLAAQTPVQFRHLTADPTFLGALTSIIDVANYDPGGLGVITPVGGGANTSTNFRIWAFANNTVTEQIFVQYGQQTYASLATATQGIGSGAFVPNPNTVAGALLGWISVIRTATDLSSPTQAVFTKAGKFSTP
jgi:hypothetical protein